MPAPDRNRRLDQMLAVAAKKTRRRAVRPGRQDATGVLAPSVGQW